MTDQMKPFTCTYQHDGRHFGLTIIARHMDEVSAHLRAVGMTARIDVGPHPKEGQLRSYGCCYELKGRWYGLRVEAVSRQDATARFRAIGTTGVVNGEQIEEIGAGFLGEGVGRALKLVRSVTRRAQK